MSDIQNILFPTDFSENTENALSFALEIAATTEATLHIMHSIEEPYDFAPIVEDVKDSLSRRVKRLFEEMEKKIKKDEKYSQLKIKTCLQTGRAEFTIREETRERDIDIVVMGTKGRTGLEKFFFGSTTAEIVQHSDIPVLAVPRDADFNRFKKIFFATRYQDHDIDALQYVEDFAKLFGASIHIFHSTPEVNLKSRIMARGFKEIVNETIPSDKINFSEPVTGSFTEAVRNQMKNKEYSLLVMVRYHDSSGLFKKNETKKISYSTKIPLLVLPVQKMITI